MSRPQWTHRHLKSRPRYPNDIRMRRLQRGWTQPQLAGLVGMNRSTLSDWECGKALPSVRRALRLAKALDTLVEHLWQDLYRRRYRPAADRYRERHMQSVVRRLLKRS